MIKPKTLIKMVRKWQRLAVLGRRRISLTRTNACHDSDASTASIADKGHFIAYTAEGKRFMVPLAYLSSNIFIELFKMSEDEFGLPGDGPITLPCDAVFMEYVMSLLRRRVVKEVERPLLSSISAHRCVMSSLFPSQHSQQLVVRGF